MASSLAAMSSLSAAASCVACSASVGGDVAGKRQSEAKTAALHVGTFDGLHSTGRVRFPQSLRPSALHRLRASPLCPLACPSPRDSATVATAVAVPAPAVPKQKIRIKLRSYWVPLLRQASEQILDAVRNTNAKVIGPVPLPVRRRLYCVLRSPFADKDSREHFEIRTHKRLIDLENPTAETIDALMQLDLPAGVDVEVKLS